jgi:diguanylate cyclase (GGDEF)-like protein
MRKLQHKVLFASIGIIISMTIAITLTSLASFREFSIRAAEEHTRTAAEIVLVSLTESMLNGTMDKRQSMLERFGSVQGLDEVRVVRSHHVNEQFGTGDITEREQDALDTQVLLQGKPVYTLVGGAFNPEFRATIPYVARSGGDVNCLACHAVPEGTVLGAVTLRASIAHMKEDAFMTTGLLVLSLVLFSGFACVVIYRVLQPLVTTANEIEHAVEKASEGDFSQTVTQRTQDEIGQIAQQFNRLSANISQRLHEIRDNVAELVKAPPESSGDLLHETATTVQGLVKVSRFKQAIEEDEHVDEVHMRLTDVMRSDFSAKQIAIHQIQPGKNKISASMVDGVPQAPAPWCSSDVAECAQHCRAVRTGRVVNGLRDPHICRGFSDELRQQGLHYLCLPVLQTGGSGAVVQLLTDEHGIPALASERPLIESYLREASPVLQAKQLMADLRENSLRCGMTGLHNRRFLEEYSESLVAQMQRRDAPMSLVMLDLDYFKQVNDTYGHDVGDQVLKDLAKILKSSVRTSDFVIRYGGEEFLLVLLDATREAAAQVAEKIRASVEAHTFKTSGGTLKKTISAGVAEFPRDGEAFWQTLKFADVALYSAKDGGRNRVVEFREDMWSGTGSY